MKLLPIFLTTGWVISFRIAIKKSLVLGNFETRPECLTEAESITDSTSGFYELETGVKGNMF